MKLNILSQQLKIQIKIINQEFKNAVKTGQIKENAKLELKNIGNKFKKKYKII